MVLEKWTQVDLVVNGGGALVSSAGVTLAKQWFWWKYPHLEMELSRNRLSDTQPKAGRYQETAGNYCSQGQKSFFILWLGHRMITMCFSIDK